MIVASSAYPLKRHNSLEDWHESVESRIKELSEKNVELAVFPEYGSMELASFFSKTTSKELIREVSTMEAEFKSLYSGLAEKCEMCIVAPGFPTSRNGEIINRSWVFSKTGKSGFQDKIFITPPEKQGPDIKAGLPEIKIFHLDDVSFGIQICYDSEFPIGSYEMAVRGVKLVLIPSCTRTSHGSTRVHLGARARAMENQFYTMVSQTIGNANQALGFEENYGFSGVYSPPELGFPADGILGQTNENTEGWLIHEFDFKKLDKVRSSGSVANFEDSKRLSMQIDGVDLKIVEVFL